MEMDHLLTFIAVGFLAQIIDGALGMAYGVSASSILLSAGVPPAVASASVHTAEAFTSAVSGIAHIRFGNVQKALFLRLAIPGMLGGAGGAYVLVSIPGERLKPYVALYLLAMGGVIIYKAFSKDHHIAHVRSKLIPLGLFGGFMDAVGGGGWGPIVSSTLMARGHEPRFAVGSVNLAEFFITTAQVFTFVSTIGINLWPIITGLIIGGVAAAPLAAYVCKVLPARKMMALVGLLVIFLSARTLYLTLF
jgi:hypothetical protein